MDTTDAVEALKRCTLAKSRINDLVLIKEQITNSVKNASHIDIATEAGIKDVENMFDELDKRAASFDKNMQAVVQQVGNLFSQSTHMLAAWPHALNLWTE